MNNKINIMSIILKKDVASENKPVKKCKHHANDCSKENLNKKILTGNLQKGFTRVTYIVRETHLEQLKCIAYWDRVTIKKIMDDVFANYLKYKGLEFFKKI